MKEIKAIHKSENYKSGVYQYELINENLYNWKISLVSFPPIFHPIIILDFLEQIGSR